jgi:hypothetical protein
LFGSVVIWTVGDVLIFELIVLGSGRYLVLRQIALALRIVVTVDGKQQKMTVQPRDTINGSLLP